MSGEQPGRIYLAEWRERKGFSQTGLALESHISRQTVVGIETGRTRLPHPVTLVSLARALDLSVRDLYRPPPEVVE